MSTTLDTDICIIGGGVAGLWLNARLRKAGYHTVLIERGALGGGQSVKSQGIIHGGIKYALGGKLNVLFIMRIPQPLADSLFAGLLHARG